MKVKILHDIYDNKRLIFRKDEIYNILYETKDYIHIKTKWNIKYCLDKKEKGISYVDEFRED